MKLTIPHAKRVQTGNAGVVSFEVPPEYAEQYAGVLRSGAKLDVYDVTIEPPRKRRSTGPGSQSHHLNGHVAQIAQSTGNDFDDVKFVVKRRAFKRGLRYMTKPDGSPVYSLIDGEPMPPSEADMSTEECAWCIEEAHLLAAEFGITLREE